MKAVLSVWYLAWAPQNLTYPPLLSFGLEGGNISFAFFMYPIGASGNDPGRIDFKLGANPSTTPFFEGGLHLNYSRWCLVFGFFICTGPVLPSWRLQKIAGGLIQFEGLRLPGVIGGLPFRTPRLRFLFIYLIGASGFDQCLSFLIIR